MKKLRLKTQHPDAVFSIMIEHELVEPGDFPDLQEQMDIDYHSDGLSQELYFWLALAQGCGLVEEYSLEDRA